MKRLIEIAIILVMFLSLCLACSPKTTPTQTEVVAPKLENTATATAMPEPTATAMPEPTATLAPTAAATEAATEAATQAEDDEMVTESSGSSDFKDKIADLYAKGDISTDEGIYFKMNEAVLRYAKLDWYSASFINLAPQNFVISSDFQGFSSDKNANHDSTGCGFAFRATDEKNHYLMILALDGYAYLYRVAYGRHSLLQSAWVNFYSYAEKNDQGIWVADANLTLAVEGDRFILYVNGDKVMTRYDPLLTSGNLGLAVGSGINKTFGTQCEFTNTEILQLDSD